MARDLFSSNDGRDLFSPEAGVEKPVQRQYASPRAKRAAELREERDTRAVRELPEIQESGLLAGEDMEKVAAISPVLLTTTNPQEIADILSENFPNIGIQYDEQGNVIAANNETGARAVINKPGLTGIDLLQGLGIGAAFFPSSRAATIPTAIASGALTESAMQGAQFASGGQFDASDVALAGITSGAGKAIEDAVSGVYRGATGSIPEEQASIIRAGEDSGVPVMTTDVIEPTTFAGKIARSTGEKIPLAGTGAARSAQQEARQDAVQQFVSKYQEPSYSDIVKSLKDKKSSVMSAAGSVLQKSGNKLDSIGEIPVEKSLLAIDDAIAELNKPNVRTSPEALKELQDMREVLSIPQTFSTLKENRTFLKDTIDSFGKGDRSQLPSNAKRLLTKARQGLTDDMESFAKENLTSKEFSSWKRANSIYGAEAEKLKKTRIKNVLDKGDYTPENVKTLLFSGKPSEVKSLYDSLTVSGKNNARSAIIYEAYNNASKRAQGLTPNTFNSELKKLTGSSDVFFKGENKRQLEGFTRLMDATRRAQDAAIETPTGQQLIGAGGAYAAFTDLGTTLGAGGTAGGLARIYESAPVRNALLRLGSVPKGSDKFLTALFEAQAALTSAAQAARSIEEEL